MSKSHTDPSHPRYCSPGRWKAIQFASKIAMARHLGRPKIRPTKVSRGPLPMPVDRVLIHRKHRVTMRRRDAFLDLNAAVARQRQYERAVKFAKALRAEMNPDRKPENVEYWLDRYREAVMVERQVFNPSF